MATLAPLVIVVVLVLSACFSEVGYRFGILDPEWLTGPIGAVLDWAAGLAKDVLKAPFYMVAGFASLACVLHNLVLMYLPVEALHLLRAEAWPKLATMMRVGKGVDWVEDALRKRGWIMWVIDKLNLVGATTMLPICFAWRIASSPTTSRLLLVAVLAPFWLAVAAWLVVPEEGRDDPDDGPEQRDAAPNRQIVRVTLVALVVFVAAYEIVRASSPAFAQWLVGADVRPRAFVAGLVAAFSLATVLSGIDVDQDASLDARDTHMSSLFVALLAAAAVHIVMPLINRSRFARIRVGGEAP